MRRRICIYSLAGILLLGYLFCLPRNLFKGTEYSTVVESAEGELLGARIAADGQWRFPPCDTVPERFATALVQFEDRQFWWHPGVNPVAMGRALIQNARSGHVVSGGSTLTMQVIRLSRQRERTVWQKIIESVLAARLELRCSKPQILALYASHAPFGGNVVGLEAAAWRYFGRPASELSWAEAATLAVLPNAPSTMHLSKGREDLQAKRNRLLLRLMEHGDLSAETYEAALEEPLPDAPLPLPSYASHFVERCPKGVRTRTSIRLPLQKAVSAVTDRQSDDLAKEGVADLAAVVMDNATGEIVAYVGNASPDRERPGVQVDIAASPRSTGSILKPFLYAAALQEGEILPNTLLPDIPVNLGGFAPQNFDRQFYGAVPASQALARSLNVPSVFLLRQYGVPKFHALLLKAGLTTLTQDPEHYGLSLILGGGEGRLDEITRAYSALAYSYQGDSLGPDGPRNDKRGDTPQDDNCHSERSEESPITDALAVWYTLQALQEVNRPDELDWRLIRSVRKAAWKTGTSYGFRDAWAVGMTPAYTIGVWAGNADGHGVPGLTGARTAGPVMFAILNLLPASDEWFQMPDVIGHDKAASKILRSEATQGVWGIRPPASETIDADVGVYANVCSESGMLASPECPAVQMLIPAAGLQSEPCPYHRTGEFVLTPAMEWFYKPHHPEYTGARKTVTSKEIEFIYPQSGTTLYLPRQLSGQVEGAVFRVAHHRSDATLWWHLDQTYVGETRFIHELRLAPDPGRHTLTVVDGDGNSSTVSFTVAE
ncbi:MAG: penicillin-binding protein 1C [Bacteroidales bacterium]|nr:penicillin-binding protein 1C [Bacteroidales bacterium]